MKNLLRGGMAMGLLWFSLPLLAATKPTPMDRVRAIAGSHALTITPRNGVYWVEVEGSDIFGTGSTVAEAVNDFLSDADLEAHEANKPHLHTLPKTGPKTGTKTGATTMDCAGSYCL